jgi:LysM repeat protein
MKSGDNPWNIARQHRVNFDDFLRLNQLDEEKARQLKPGDKLRVR